MTTTHPNSILWTLICLSVAALAIAAYITGYFRLGLRAQVYEGAGIPKIVSIYPLPGGKAIVVRQYRGDWPTTIYQPLAQIESAATGSEVRLVQIADPPSTITVTPLR